MLVYNRIKGGAQVYTIQEIADIMKVRRNAISRWISQGDLPVIRINQRMVRIRKEEFEKFLEARKE